MNYLFNLLALNKIRGLGPVRIRQIISQFEDNQIEKILSEVNLSSILSSSFREEYYQLLKNGLERTIQKEIEFCVNNKIRIIPFWSAEFPHRLKQINDFPILIYVKGEPILNPAKSVAIVGTRKPSPISLQWLEKFMEEIGDEEIQIISGLAYGIDIQAHKNALKLRQSTLAVMGHGLDQIYPRQHAKTSSEMIESNGGLLSEMGTMTNLHPDLFPRRNRIIAALSDAVIVVESKVTGGSMSTAQLAHQYNRDVFAVPTLPNIKSGCNALIKRNTAQLIETGSDFINYMGWNIQTNRTNRMRSNLFDNSLSQEHRQILEIWESNNQEHVSFHFDEIYKKSCIKMSRLPQILLELELKGIIIHTGQKLFQLTSK
jgi:DNA processing protein